MMDIANKTIKTINGFFLNFLLFIETKTKI